MNIEQANPAEQALSKPPKEAIQLLKEKTVVVPSWAKLEKEYDKKKHPVMTDAIYNAQIEGGEMPTHVTLGWQKLATKRMTELIFGIPARRIYKPDDEQQERAAEILEDVFLRNRINSVNLARGRALFASCEIATIWYTQEQATAYAGNESALKVRCKTYSPMDGAELYPLFDDYDDLVALSVGFTRARGDVTTSYFETYTASKHIRFKKEERKEWEIELEEDIRINKIVGVYAHRQEPIWEDESGNVYEVEWTLSRQGNYIRKNARPTWVEFTEKPIPHGAEPKPSSAASRNILRYGSNDKAGFVTWDQAIDSIKFYIDTMRSEFFSQLQLPRMSFEEMKTTPMSGESRKMMFIDSILKVKDESGLWIEFFSREINVVKAICGEIYPELAEAFERLTVEVVITPFTISDKKEQAEILSIQTGGRPVKSQLTAIQELGEADNAAEELERINDQSMLDIMEPSF